MAEEHDWRETAKRQLAAEISDESAELSREIAELEERQKSVDVRRANIQKKLDAAKALGIELAPSDFAEVKIEVRRVPSPSGELTARDIILKALADAAPQPMKAAALREVIEERLGREIHYKTPGMTLYRMAEAGEVYRKGHNWYLKTEGQGGNDDNQEREFDL